MSRRATILCWSAFLAAALVAVAFRLQISFDLAYFLPRGGSAAEEVVRKLAGDTPGSRMVMALVPGDDADQARRDAAVLAERLASLPGIRWVHASSGTAGVSAIPRYIWTYRYLLADQDLSREGLRADLSQRLSEFMLVGSPDLVELLRNDPTLASLRVLEALDVAGPTEIPVVDGLGGGVAALLVAETRAPAFDLVGQAEVVAQIGAAARDEGLAGVELLGMGPYGLEVQQTIRNEAVARSLLATLAVIGIVWLFFRRLSLALVSGLPLALGFVAGLAAVSVCFQTVHGITLAFGFTLLGVTIDYPLHLLSHAREQGGAGALQTTWPVIRLGAISTAMAYGALALTGSSGLAQLGIFSAAGTVVAALAVRSLFPALGWPMEAAGPGATAGAARPASLPAAAGWQRWIWAPLLVLACAGLATSGRPVWDNSLATMSPVPEQVLARDARLRKAAGTPNMRYLLAVHGPDLETTLQRTERLGESLRLAVQQGTIEGWVSISSLLPSLQRQQARKQDLPAAAELAASLEAAMAGLPFRSESFAPFRAAVEQARGQQLGLEQLTASDIGGLAQGMLYREGAGWVSLVALRGDPDTTGLSAVAGQFPTGQVVLVDLVQGSQALIDGYRASATRVIALTGLLILGLLALSARDARSAAWVVASTATAMVLTVAILHLYAGSLSVFHFVSLLMIAGIGMDYGLFISSPEGSSRATSRALLACMATTGTTFAILGFSELPVLNAIGSTVATGVVTCYALTALPGALRAAAKGSRR